MSDGSVKAKIGDGVKKYNELPFSDKALQDLINSLGQEIDAVDNRVTGVNTRIDDVNKSVGTAFEQISGISQDIESIVSETLPDYANQHAFSKIAINNTNIDADTATDTLTIAAGNNISITPDATGDKITFAVADGTIAAKGVIKLTDSTASTSTTTAATPNSVKQAYDKASTAEEKAAEALTVANSKAAEGHSHNTLSSSTNAGSNTQPVYFNAGMPTATTHTLGASVPSGAKFTDTTYDLAVSTNSANGNVKLNLITGGSGSGTDSVTIKGSGATTVTTDANGVVNISSTDTNTYNDTTYSFATGDSNGQIKVTPSSGNAYNVSVKGLGSAAWSASTAFATANHDQASNSITAMTGYSKPSTTSAIATTDTLNTAIGKLEKALDTKGTSSLTLGTSSATAYRGDYGNTAYTHSQSAHAPSNAQKNSDITKAEIEAKLTGSITSHTHDYSTSDHTHNYAAASTAGGSATSAVKLDTATAGSTTQPVYFSGGKPVACTYTLGASVPSTAKFTDTTYSGNNGISLSGTTFSNSGVRSIATGSANGTISVNTNGTAADVAVKGLGTAAYTASTAYAEASHTSDTTAHITASERTTWNAKGTSNLTIGTTATTAAAGNHAHGNITNSGTITSTAITAATGVLVYDSDNKIQRATAADARSIIGAGTSSLTLGTTATTAAKGNHTHSITAANFVVPSSLIFDSASSLPSSGTAGQLYFVKRSS